MTLADESQQQLLASLDVCKQRLKAHYGERRNCTTEIRDHDGETSQGLGRSHE